MTFHVFFLPPIRKKDRQLEQALTCVREAKEAALQLNSGIINQDIAEKTLKHLLLHVDPEELYRVALGMYDLPLAYMVISNAQVRMANSKMNMMQVESDV